MSGLRLSGLLNFRNIRWSTHGWIQNFHRSVHHRRFDNFHGRFDDIHYRRFENFHRFVHHHRFIKNHIGGIGIPIFIHGSLCRFNGHGRGIIAPPRLHLFAVHDAQGNNNRKQDRQRTQQTDHFFLPRCRLAVLFIIFIKRIHDVLGFHRLIIGTVRDIERRIVILRLGWRGWRGRGWRGKIGIPTETPFPVHRSTLSLLLFSK